MDNRREKQTVRPIGAYLAERLQSASKDVEQALTAQGSLARQGRYQPLGSILASFPGIAQPILEECLRTQRADILGLVDIFSSLPPIDLQKLAAALTTRILPPATAIFSQEDPPTAFYVVVSGGVRIMRRESDGATVVLAQRLSGEGFGEIAVLTGAPHSSCAETMDRTSLLEIPADMFLDTIFSHPSSARVLAGILAERLSSGYSRIVDATEAEQAYRRFIAEQLRRDEPMLIGSSPVVMKLISEIETLAGSGRAILVRGEPGAELKDAAGLIHDMGRDGSGLLLSMDAKTGDEAVDSGNMLALELHQTGALFGRGRNAVPFAPDRKPGLLAIAAGGTVVIENIECLAPRVQDRLARYLETGDFSPIGETGTIRSDVRVIATTSADLEALTEAGAFDRRLKRLLAARPLIVPPLRRRKQDIAVTVEELIKRNNRALGKNIAGVDEEAYHSLINYDWPGNTEELRVVIRRAVSIAQGSRLSIEDIFIVPPPVSGKYTLDLLAFAPLRKLFTSEYYPKAAHVITIPFILAIAGLGLFGTQTPDRNIALILTWGLWEPTLVLSALFTSRAWCSVCPIGAISGLVRKYAGRNLKVPAWIKNKGFYLTATGIALIFWLETAFAMPVTPAATAMLVIPLVLFAGLAGFLFQRRTWCRYICPLGGMMGVFASTSILEMRSNYGICNSTCLKHECYAGTDDREGCPMFEGPFALTSNRNCALCANCVKICPHHSPVLNLRLPGYDLWTARTPDTAFAVITITLLGTQLFRGMEKIGALEFLRGNSLLWWGGTPALLIIGILFAWLFAYQAGRTAFGMTQDRGKQTTLRVSYVLLPLVFGFEAGFHLERFLKLVGQFLPVLGRQLNLSAELPGYSAPAALIGTVQALMIALGTTGAAAVLRNTLKSEATGIQPLFRRLRPVLFLAILYLFFFLAG